ncbi:MAG: TonB family protein [Turneriella sp.]|nr:TonB family protein [Turneriella sp.]
MTATADNKPFRNAFVFSLGLHLLLLFLLWLLFHPEEPLQVALVIEREPLRKQTVPEEEVPRSRRSLQSEKKSQAAKPSHPKRAVSALNNPWSEYEKQLFRSQRAGVASTPGAQHNIPQWGSENTGHLQKASSGETINVPAGKSSTSTRWKKGAARRLLSLPPIEYPESIRRRSGQGVVELLIEVNEHGRVENVEILKSSGITRLDLNARNAYRQAIFSPSASGENAVGVVTVTFRLKDD